jgi:hypothetical protein
LCQRDAAKQGSRVSIVLSTYLVLITYLLVSAIVIGYLDAEAFGDFADAFYFVFITTATIGFGDVMPRDRNLLKVMVFLTFGMSVLSWFVSALYSRVSLFELN